MALEITFSGLLEIINSSKYFIVGMLVYAIFIFKFYKFLANRDIFELNLIQYNRAEHPLLVKTLDAILYILEYLVIFPIFTFFWFSVISLLFIFLVKNQKIDQILMISAALVVSIRVTAYYNNELSIELAKVIPFSFLAIFLLDIYHFKFSDFMDIVKEIPSFLNIIIYYLIFIVSIEYILRLLYSIFGSGEKQE